MRIFTKKQLLTGITLASSLLALSAQAAPNAVTVWEEAILDAIRTTRPGPPMTARAIAMVNTCMYDAWAPYDKKAAGTMLGNSLRRPVLERTDANKTQAISYAAYRAAVDLFPARKANFDALLTSQGFDPANMSMDVATPAGVGNKTCQALLDFRHHDGANQLGDLAPGAYKDYTGYVAVNTPTQINDPNRWQPLIVGGAVQPFLGAQWFKVTPFALTSTDQYVPASVKPAMYGSQKYIDQAKEVIAYQANLTDYQKSVAEYWADGPNSEFPPGHWMLFGLKVSARDNHSIDQDAKMFFALGNAMHDAAITAWTAKRKFDYVRPITAIHYLFANETIQGWGGPGQGTISMLGSQWQTYQASNFNTPPFPEWFSGHSTFSAAGAAVLRNFTKSDVLGVSDIVRAGSSRVEPGLVPAADIKFSWATFTDAADDAGISRRYGGIHFIQGDLDGRTAGKKVGNLVWRKASEYFRGVENPVCNLEFEASTQLDLAE
ncbi:MAG TPA: vanadium-dependent haloperoxidase [Cellvibrionaceae bacterium]|nr:vanadium-dependent haloperoxidase [Cellvibrionaceae bacterium]HMY38025.1 vanadium-dependent haloperoxidase [Marinagarivorans sp.]HNG59931.1 vanadium-dependent haloperoxidase [Cellvibrionaceae bacterium]